MKDETLNYLESVVKGAETLIQSIENEDFDWRPSYGGRSILELVTHIATLIESDIKGGLGDLNSAEKMAKYEKSANIRSTKDAVNRLNNALSYAKEIFGGLTTENMNTKKVQFFYQEEPETYTHLLVELIEHLSIHKGILFSYLKQIGYDAGMTTYYGISPASKK